MRNNLLTVCEVCFHAVLIKRDITYDAETMGLILEESGATSLDIRDFVDKVT